MHHIFPHKNLKVDRRSKRTRHICHMVQLLTVPAYEVVSLAVENGRLCLYTSTRFHPQIYANATEEQSII